MTGLMLAIASIAALFAVAALVHAIGARHELSAETQRKLVHVAVGLHAIALPYFLDRTAFLIFAAMAALALAHLRRADMKRGIGAAIHAVQRRSWGDLLLLLAVTVLFLRAPGDPLAYTLPLAVLTLSDAAAAVVGSHYGQHRFGQGDRIKSIEGTVVFFMVTWSVAAVILIALTDVPRENIVWLAVFIASFSALVEVDSWRGLDNLFVPLAIHTMANSWGDADPRALASLALLWVALLILAHHFAEYLGTTRHAARSGLVAFFLTVATVRWPSAVFPVLALGAYLLGRPRAEDLSQDNPDFVLLLIMIGVFWLLVGGLFGRDATAFYVASFAAVACGYVLASFEGKPLAIKAIVATATAAIAVFVYAVLTRKLEATALWPGEQTLLIVAAMACALVLLLVLVKPESIVARKRSWRLGIAALAAPTAGYLYGVLA
jgi:dolichol kinase